MSERHRKAGRKGYKALLRRYGADGVQAIQARGAATTNAQVDWQALGRVGGQISAQRRADRRALDTATRKAVADA